MSNEILVGSTGFVGSNLLRQHSFAAAFHSTDIDKAYGMEPDLLVYAGLRAEMFLANRNPDADRRLVEDAVENIRRIRPKELVFISTVAVYSDTYGADEDSTIDETGLSAYGRNRLALERWAEEEMPRCLILRLPAIYGVNLKKNFLYDYLHVIPSLLSESLFCELSAKAPILKRFYAMDENGYYRYAQAPETERELLKQTFSELGFTALNFTDSRSVYQFYWLKNLWRDMEIARKAGLRRLNLVTPPVSVSEVFRHLTGREFVNCLDRPPFSYDLRTKYAYLYSGENGYLMSREQELSDIREYIRQNGGDCL